MLCENLLDVLDPEPHGAALNMAIDEVLLQSAREPILRRYEWAGPALSFGYFEKWAALPALPSGWESVRRWTGGGVVEHGRDVTYTLIVPAGHALARLPPGDCYRVIHERIAALLGEQGIAVELALTAAPKISSGCFENPAASDVLAGGRKLAGAAQRRTRHGLLHQGSIQGVADRAACSARLPGSLARSVRTRLLSAAELEAGTALAATRYATREWERRF